MDDEESIRQIIRERYSADFIVISAEGRVEAMNMLNTMDVAEIPDMVLTDLDMEKKLEGILLIEDINRLQKGIESAVMSARDVNDPKIEMAKRRSTSGIYLEKPKEVQRGSAILVKYLQERKG